jgi:hypothetical protein
MGMGRDHRSGRRLHAHHHGALPCERPQGQIPGAKTGQRVGAGAMHRSPPLLDREHEVTFLEDALVFDVFQPPREDFLERLQMTALSE